MQTRTRGRDNKGHEHEKGKKKKTKKTNKCQTTGNERRWKKATDGSQVGQKKLKMEKQTETNGADAFLATCKEMRKAQQQKRQTDNDKKQTNWKREKEVALTASS